MALENDCALCAEVKNTGRRFYSGKLCVAIVPTSPIAPFHAMVMPKRHVTEMSDLKAAELKEMFGVMGRMSSFVESHYSGPALIALNRKGNSSQPHLHFHIINTPAPAMGIRMLYSAKTGVPFYPECSEAELARRAKEYSAFVEAEKTD